MNDIHYEISSLSYIKENRLKYAIEILGVDHIILGSDNPSDKDSLENNTAGFGRLNIDSTAESVF